MKSFLRKPSLLLLIIISQSFACIAADTKNAPSDTDKRHLKYQPELVGVPFVFSSESLGFAVGGAAILKHAGQIQSSLLGVGLVSDNRSWLTYLNANSYQLPNLNRWLFSLDYFHASYQEGIYYLRDTSGQDLLHNNNTSEQVVTYGQREFIRLHLKYVLPWGRGAEGAIGSLIPTLANKVNWNPIKSGVGSITLIPFYKRQRLENYEFLPSVSKGLKLKLDWDNRDNGKNSTKGGRTSLFISRDFGGQQRQSWTTWEFEQSLFVELPKQHWSNSQVVAFNFYIADTPTWNSYDSSAAQYHRPPSFTGVSLGGFNRLRGYSSHQFVGRSALLYSLEYRLQPEWQPLQTWPVFDLYNIPWWQWTVFTEFGQVSDTFDLKSLHQDMKWTVGAGIRFDIEGVVVRTDYAVAAEESQVWVMINQAF